MDHNIEMQTFANVDLDTKDGMIESKNVFGINSNGIFSMPIYNIEYILNLKS